jgi:putative ABC transport system permease protein
METLIQDERFALRGLRQRPGFAFVAVLTLALGIGANAAIFSVANGVLLRPLPYLRPAELVMVWGAWEANPRADISVPEYWDLREQSRSIERLAAFAEGTENLTGSGTPERLRAGYATADALPLLGVSPALGRNFAPAEDLPGQTRVVLLSDGLWRRRFAADPAVVGRTLMLDDAPAQVVGVLPASFQLPLHYSGPPMELWLPLQLDPAIDRSVRGWHFLRVVGRLRPGATVESAKSEVPDLARRMRERYPTEYTAGFTGWATPVMESVVGQARPAILVLLGAVGLLLLIACANVASLQLARGESRQREIAVRTALGAGRGRIIRQLLTESVLLAAAGAAVGLLLALWGVRALIAAAPATIPRLDEIGLDPRVLLFTAAVAVGTGLLFGLAPALHAAKTDLAGTLTEGGRAGTSGSARQRFRRGLVMAQIALALMLVTGAGLLLRSFVQLTGVDPGFDPEHLLTARIELSSGRYETKEQARAFYEQLLTRVEALPGVRSAAAVRALPMTGRLDIGDWSFVLEGKHSTPPLPSEWHPADWQAVTPDYFQTMGIPLLQGRGLEAGDRIGAPGAMVINQSLARQVWPAGDALGQRVLLGGGSSDSIWRTVVGIVGDVRHRGFDAAPRPEMYLPHAQFPAGTGFPQRSMYLVVRSIGDPASLAPAIRAAVDGLDSDVPLAEVQTMEHALGSWAAERRLTMMVVSGFALVALTLGAVGIYGIMAHLVVQRTREIGIRIALGAVPGEILRLVLVQAAWLVGVGIAAGVVGALPATGLLSGLLFGVRPTDPATFAGTALILALVAAVASLVPARRAIRVNPLEALRSE